MTHYDWTNAGFVREIVGRFTSTTAFDDFTKPWERLADELRLRWAQAVGELFSLVENAHSDSQIAEYIDLNVSGCVRDMGQLVEQLRNSYTLTSSLRAFVTSLGVQE